MFIFVSLQLALTGCGWKFRVLEDKMPFSTIYLSGINNGVGTEIYQRLKRAPGVKIITNKSEAQVSLTLKVKTDRVVVGFSGAGRPRELEIRTTAVVEIIQNLLQVRPNSSARRAFDSTVLIQNF